MKTPRLVAFGVLSLLAACKSMQPVPLAFISQTNPAVVYLADGSGAIQAVANPRLGGDSVFGTVLGSSQEIAVPLREVQRVSTVRVNRGRTAMLIGGLTVAGGLMAYTLLSTAGGETAFYCDYNNPAPPTAPAQCSFPTN